MLYESKIDLIMKGFFKYIAVAMAMTLIAIGCAPDILVPDQGKLPEASAMEVVITPDQTTNYVTFSVKNARGFVPMWIFGEDKIDGKASKNYTYVGNDLVLRIREEGTHKVEVKAYNANGVSMGSQICEYTLDNTYRDPFDPSPYMKAIAGEWQWNNEADKHFGCGPNLADPISWWGAGANEKADWSLYNDLMTFTADGKYSFNPGEDGKVYVNAGFSALGTSPDGNDFLVDIPAYETTYAVENSWNAAGIEEIWIVLPEHKNLSYIPNQTIYDDPRFLVMDSKPSAMRKELKLAAAEAPNGDGTISWYYNFIPAVKTAGPEELLAGTDAAGKVWVMDSSVQGHLGCGPDAENPASWWSAAPDEKKDFGLYDDAITFFPDGKYVYDSGEDGKMYINWGVTAIGPNPGAEPDIDIEQADVESTYTFDGETITLAANTPMVYVPSDKVWAEPVFHVTSITETTLVVVAENPGCYWQMIFRARDAKVPGAAVVIGSKSPEDITMAQGDKIEFAADINLAETWIDPDFFKVEGAGYVFNAVDGDYRFTYDSANKWIKVIPLNNGQKATYDNGNALWIIGDGGGKPTVNQLIGWNTGDAPLPFAQTGDNTYQITLAMKGEGGSIKVFGQSDWGTEWKHDGYGTFNGNGLFKLGDGTGGDRNDDGNIYHTESPAGYYTFTVVDNGGILDMSVAAATIVTPGTPEEPKINMWERATKDQITTYFVSDWGQPTLDVEYEIVDGGYKIVIPEGTGTAQWMGQFAVNHTNIVTTKDKAYDFQFVLNSSADHPGVTIKATYFDPNKWDSNNNSWGADGDAYFDAKHVLKAGEDYVYEVKGKQGLDIPCLKLVFDFGGAVGGSTVEIKDIIIKEGVLAPEEPEPEPGPGAFTPGEQLDLIEAADVLVGTWTWESSTDGHFGCGDAIANPVGWWNGPADCKADASMYDDTMTFAEDGTYTFDPVDGHSYINTGVTKLDAVKVDQPYGDDWRITAEKMTCSYSVEETGEYPSIVLEAGTYFSYVPNDAFLEAPELYITGVWENQIEISAYTATGNNGGPIAWRYRLKRIN